MNKRSFVVVVMVAIFILVVQVVSAQNTLTLEQCLDLARNNNKSIKIAEENLNKAETQVREAKAGYLPQLNASATGFYLGEPINTLFPESGVNGALTLEQPIYAGGKIRTGNKLAAKGYEIQQENSKMVLSDVMLHTEEAYWNVVAVKEKIKLSDEYHKLLTSLLNDLTNSYEAGLIYKNDLLKVKVQLYEVELNKQRAKDGLTIAKMYLGQLVGLDASSVFVSDALSVNPSVSNDSSIVQSGLQQRSEIKMLEKAIEVSELQQKMLKADFLPTVGAQLNGVYAYGKEINFSDRSDDLSTVIGLVSVNIPLVDWGQRKQKLKRQQYETSRSELELSQTQDLIAIEINQAILTLQQAQKELENNQLALQQAEENLKLSTDRHEAGTITGSDVLEAQALWQESYSNLIDAKINYKVSEARLVKALGESK